MVVKLVAYYIWYCIVQGVPPWRFFQLNAQYFNAEKGVFSKIDLDQHIPKPWRLKQYYLNQDNITHQYPVFIKPEWGQNSYGISVVKTQDEMLKVIQKTYKVPYIVQHLASGKIEYEVFYIQDPDNHNDYITLTITEVSNHHEKHPINSIYNQHTQYIDKTNDFSKQEQHLLKQHLAKIPCFRIARVALKTNSKLELLQGDFKIIEINLFTPFPINLLDKNQSHTHHQFIKDNMWHLAKLSGKITREHFKPFLFFKKLRKHYQIQS